MIKIFFLPFILFCFFLGNNLNAVVGSRMVLLPNSHILVCGGRHADSNFDNDCYLIYSEEYGVAITTPVYYYPNILGIPRSSHTMTLLPDGRILVAGGYDNSGTPINDVRIITMNFDNVTSTSVVNTTMSTARAEHTATLITYGEDAGNVLICGGYTIGGSTNSCEIFITSATSSPYFKPGPTMITPRQGHSATILPSGKIFIAGGYDTTKSTYNIQTEIYDPTNKSLTVGPSLLIGRAYHTALSLPNGYTMIVGGYNGYNYPDIFSKDDSITQNLQRQGTWGYVDLVEMFDSNGGRTPVSLVQVNTGQDSSFELLPFRSVYHTSVLLSDGSILMRGGRGNIPVTYLSAQLTALNGSYVSVSPTSWWLEYGYSTGTRISYVSSATITLQSDNNRLSRYVSGRIVEGDWFLKPREDEPSVSFKENGCDIYLGITTGTLDTVFVTEGWLGGTSHRVKMPLQGHGSGSYTRFYPLSLNTERSEIGYITDANLKLYDVLRKNEIFSLPESSAAYIANSTITVYGFIFRMPKIYAGATIIAATMTIKNAGGQKEEIASINLTYGEAEIRNIPIRWDGLVTIDTITFTNVSGMILNTADYDLGSSSGDYGWNGNYILHDISFNISFVASTITFVNENGDGVEYMVDPSTIVIRDMLFSNLSRFYPISGEFYLNDQEKTGRSYIPTMMHSMLVNRSGGVITLVGENCESNPLNCRRTSFNPPVKVFNPLPVDVYLKMNHYFSGLWLDGPKLTTKRAFHTLTVLSDGSLLACGGTDGVKTLDTCEMYDNKEGNWVIIGTMTVARAYHTATLLPNGTVLIAGGTSGRLKESAALSDAEIFWPNIGKTVKIKPLNRARLLHTATILPDGNILFTGGASLGSYLNSAEIFITTENAFVEIGSTTPRGEHTATLLQNGNVLICGGVNHNSVLKTCEMFDSRNRTFSSAAPMNFPRKTHTATLLDNGLVLVFGGSNETSVLDSAEVYNPATNTWSILPFSFVKPEEIGDNNDRYIGRANHNAVILPDKSVVFVGGETIYRQVIKPFQERFYTDTSNIVYYGVGSKRVGCASAFTKDNMVVVSGGYDGTSYLDSVEGIYYSYTLPDSQTFPSNPPRKPYISLISTYAVTTATFSFTPVIDNEQTIIIYSTYSNFHSLTTADGSGVGSQSSDFSKPYFVLTSLNGNYSLNLSTMLYVSSYNPKWDVTTSTVVMRTPARNSLPYGWYYLHACVEGICSDPYIIQISTPRPKCVISTPTVIENSIGVSSMSWQWNLIDLKNNTVANGFAVFRYDDLFLSTVPFPSPITSTVTFRLDDLKPNTLGTIKIACYNIGGFSDKNEWAVVVSTVYTLAKPPKCLNITYASYNTVELEWDGSGNPDYTQYQLEISTKPDFSLYSPVIRFINNYTQTKATIRNLEPNTRYYFRVKARNGNNIETLYDTQNPESNSSICPSSYTYNRPVSTITVGNIVGLNGIALSSTSIRWSWNPSGGATGYEIYDYKVKVDPLTKEELDVSVLITTTSNNFYIQSGLKVNTPYQVKVRSFKNDEQTQGSTVFGPFAISTTVFTLAAPVGPAYPSVFTEVTTGSIKVNWDANGNPPDWTDYEIEMSNYADFRDFNNIDIRITTETYPTFSTVVSGLKPNTPYYFRVYSVNGSGIRTPEPTIFGPKYTLAQPPKRVYVSSITINGVVVNWDPDENPPYTPYQLRVTSVSFETPSVSTPIPFGLNYTSTSYLVTGLWLKTSYYFEVTARNMEGILTASVQTSTPALTVSGPPGAPPASVGAEINPDEDTIIKGVFRDGREFLLTFLKGTFKEKQEIAVASLDEELLYQITKSSNPCGYTFGGSTIAFGFYTYQQPYLPVKFEFVYTSTEGISGRSPVINGNYHNVVLARWNPITGQCLPVKTDVDTGFMKVSSYLNHFSIYQLIMVNPSTNLNNIKVFPNPFYPNKPGQCNITFVNLPSDAELKFYTLSGVEVYKTKADPTGIAWWDGRNSKGQFVGSGVYLVVVKSKYGKKIIKVAVER